MAWFSSGFRRKEPEIVNYLIGCGISRYMKLHIEEVYQCGGSRTVFNGPVLGLGHDCSREV